MLSQLHVSSSPTACPSLHSQPALLRIVSVLAMALKRCTGAREHDCKDLVSCFL
jgi:hypothetical protein